MSTFTDMTILADHPVRKVFAGCSTQNVHYSSRCTALSLFEVALDVYGLRFDYVDLPGDHGRIVLNIWTDVPENTICVGRAVITWGRTSDGRCWFTGHII